MPGRQTRLRRPVISVGNLSMGGRGKTPLVAALARLLVEAGERPAILSRGYGRRHREDGVVIVSDGRHLRADLDRAGDEPLMLARAVPGAAVLVCEQRALAGALAERVLGATVHLLDDGFQHFGLHRDLDLVIVAPEDLKDRPVPFGRLRESIAALRAADAIVADGEADAVGLPAGDAPVFVLTRAVGAPLPLEAQEDAPAAGATVVTLAGIARPERFTRAIEDVGWRVARSLSFADHHRYRSSDLAAMAVAVRETSATAVLTTEKDAVRLRPLRPLPVPVFAVPLEVRVEPASVFHSWIFARLQEARR